MIDDFLWPEWMAKQLIDYKLHPSFAVLGIHATEIEDHTCIQGDGLRSTDFWSQGLARGHDGQKGRIVLIEGNEDQPRQAFSDHVKASLSYMVAAAKRYLLVLVLCQGDIEG